MLKTYLNPKGKAPDENIHGNRAICPDCGRELARTSADYFHYTDCGLYNVYLRGIKQYECQECGRRRFEIPDVEALHFMIAVRLVFKMEPLTRDEMRYLIRIIKKKCWRSVNCFLEDSYTSGPMVLRWTGKKWEYVHGEKDAFIPG